jgi:hypothetical protein
MKRIAKIESFISMIDMFSALFYDLASLQEKIEELNREEISDDIIELENYNKSIFDKLLYMFKIENREEEEKVEKYITQKLEMVFKEKPDFSFSTFFNIARILHLQSFPKKENDTKKMLEYLLNLYENKTPCNRFFIIDHMPYLTELLLGNNIDSTQGLDFIPILTRVCKVDDNEIIHYDYLDKAIGFLIQIDYKKSYNILMKLQEETSNIVVKELMEGYTIMLEKKL